MRRGAVVLLVAAAAVLGLASCGSDESQPARPAPTYKYLRTKKAVRYERTGPSLDWGTRAPARRATKGFRFDAQGIPQRNIPGGGRDAASRELGGPDEYFYNPVGIAQEGIQ